MIRGHLEVSGCAAQSDWQGALHVLLEFNQWKNQPPGTGPVYLLCFEKKI